jgi:hypothetical protein
LVFLRDGLRSDLPAFELVLGNLAAVAKMERVNLATRVRSSINYLRTTAHRWAGGVTPYGYVPAPHPSGTGRTLELDTTEVVIIGEMADRILSGEPRYRIALDLTSRKIPTPRSAARLVAQGGRRNGGRVVRAKGPEDTGEWSARAIQKLMLGSHLLGYVTHHGAVVTGEDGTPVQAYPAALDHDRWLRLQAVIPPMTPTTTGERREQQNRRAARLLSGVVYCGACGRKMYVKGTGVKSPTPRYMCSSRSNGFACPGNHIDATAFEAHVSTTLVALLTDVDVVEVVEVAADNAAVVGAVEQAITATLARMREDSADLAALAAELAVLKNRAAELRSAPAQHSTVTRSRGRFGDLWTATDDDRERRKLLGAVVERFYVFPGEGQRFTPARVVPVANPEYNAVMEAMDLPEPSSEGTVLYSADADRMDS